MMHTRIVITCALVGGAALAPAQAQQFVISAFAGGPSARTPVPALTTAIGSVQSIATDLIGNVYFSSLYAGSPAYYHGKYGVFRLDPSGVLTRIAGNTGEGYSGDGGPAIDAQFRLSNFDGESGMPGVAVDSPGNVYIADSGNNRVRRIDSTGIITTVAGDGTSGNSGDGGPATSAQLVYPSSLAVDYNGNLYIAVGDRIRKVSRDGIITTAATAAPGSAIAVDSHLNLYIAGGGSVRLIMPNGVTMTVAGEDGLGIAVDSASNIYLAQAGRIRKYASTGFISTVAGNLGQSVAVDYQGSLFVADAVTFSIHQVSAAGVVSTVAGNGDCCYSGDGGLARNALLNLAPWGGGLAVDGQGSLYIADTANQRVRKVSPLGIITTVAGNGVSNGYSGDGGPAIGAQLNYPSNVAVDSRGNVYIADSGNAVIRKVSPSGIISTVAQGGGRALAVDQADNLYFLDASGVRKLSASGNITTFTTTQFNLPYGAAVDSAGNLYIAEAGAAGSRVRKITPAGVITTVAGNGTAGYSGDGGPAAGAQLNGPVAIAADSTGNIYIADSYNARIRVVYPSGIITTIAGNGGAGYSGDGGPATFAQIGSSTGLAIDRAGNLYVADQYYNAIRVLQPPGTSVIVTGITNAASNLAGPIAPGELIVIAGSGLGPAQIVSAAPGSDGLYAAQLAGTTVMVNDSPVPVIYTSAKQVAAVVPDSVSIDTAQVTVAYLGQTSALFPVAVAPAAPGIFTQDATGQGHAATIDQKGSINSPADGFDVITLFVTGLGQATSAVTIHGFNLPVTPMSVGAGNVPGVMQIKLPIPGGQDCDTAVVIQVGNASSQQGVTIAVKQCI